MKNVLVFALLISLVGCENSARVKKSYKTIMLQSVGEIEALPNEAKFSIELFCMNPSVKASKDCLVQKSNALIEKLQSYGIKKEDILTTAVNLNKSYRWENNSNVFEGYRSSTSLIVTVKNLNTLDEIYTELLGDASLQLGGMSYHHSNIDSLENLAYTRALQKSEVLADKLLEKLPEDDKEIIQIGNIKIESSMPQPLSHDMNAVAEQTASVANKSIGMSAGSIRIQATLFVEFKID